MRMTIRKRSISLYTGAWGKGMSFFRKFAPSDMAVPRETQDVMDNLSHILSTKKDYGAMVNDFGIVDLRQYSYVNDIIHKAIAEIRYSVEQYEPRVEIIAIYPLDKVRPIQIQMDCKIKQHEQRLQIRFSDRLSAVSIRYRP